MKRYIRKKSSKRYTKLFLYLLLAGLLFPAGPRLYSGSAGIKFFKNYTNLDYDHHTQNWEMLQAENGILYAANQGGVLEYDGANWRVIQVPGYDPARSIAIGADGVIYVGGQNNLGYLEPDDRGKLTFKSLLDKIPGDQKEFGNVWGTLVIENHIYFDTSGYLFRWTPQEKKMAAASHEFRAFFKCRNNLYARCADTGFRQITQMVNNRLETVPVPGGQFFAKAPIKMLIPLGEEKILIGTKANGLFINDGKTTTPFVTDADEYLKLNTLYSGTRLSSGDFALATRNGGLVVVTPSGRQKYLFNKKNGLQNNIVRHIFEDREGNIWLSLNNGITKVEYAAPFSYLNEQAGLTGAILSITRHKGRLYVGTSDGLSIFTPPLSFSKVPGINRDCAGLVSTGGSLLAATDAGIFEIRDNKIDKITGDFSRTLSVSRQYPGHVWCGTANGLVLIKRENNRWVEAHRISFYEKGIPFFISEDKRGRLWIATNTNKLLGLDFPGKYTNPKIVEYDKDEELPESRIHMAEVDGNVIFATQQGLYRFDYAQIKFFPDFTLGEEFAGGSGKDVFRIYKDQKKNIWFHSNSRNYQAFPNPDGDYLIHSFPFQRLNLIQTDTIFPDAAENCTWFGRADRLICYDTKQKRKYETFSTHIRRVTVNSSPLFFGYNKKNSTAKANVTEIEFKDRKNFLFEFSGSSYATEPPLQYSYFLQGQDKNWSDWQTQNSKEFTVLDYGDYTFRVQARNVYGHEGTEAQYRFRILPPWYLTWLAYILYGAGLVLIIFYVVKWRIRKLERDKQKLEKTIEDRTTEIRDKNQQLETQTNRLRDQAEKLKEMDKVKSRFFANISHEFRTPLTLIMSPLDQILSEDPDNKHKKNLDLMQRNSQRVLNLINQLLDLARFDSGKMKLKPASHDIIAFLKGVISSFKMLEQQQQLTFEFQSEEKNIPLFFDSKMMEELSYNILFNAVKFTPPGGTITVSVSIEHPAQPGKTGPGPGFVKISVQDTGTGIPKEKLPFIFDRFFQSDNNFETDQKGTGIGLALTREIVKLHHGKIDVRSQENVGTEFIVRFPLGSSHLKPEEITRSSPKPYPLKTPGKLKHLHTPIEPPKMQSRDTGKEINGETQAAEETGKTGDDQKVCLEKPVILVVEDNADMRGHIRASLQPGFSVLESRDGDEGVAQAKEIMPDLIISDIMMPKKDGCQLTKELKNHIKTSHIPIILLTAKAEEENIIEGLETGADDYITKPFNTQILLSRIKNLIDLRRQMQLKIQREKTLLPVQIAATSLDDKFLKQFQEIIYKHLDDTEFSIDVICEALKMGRSTLFKKIQALTGETPNEFIRSYRLAQGAHLLKSNYGNVIEVAMAVGFSSSSYFSKCFKEKFKQSPSAFQATHSNS